MIQRLVPLAKALPRPGLRFVTNRIDNDEFLFSSLSWPFPTDSRGEDISSKHTPRSKRAALVTHRPFTSPYPTVAANEIIIDFHLYNPTNAPRYLEMLYLVVERVFLVTPAMLRNTWLPILEPHRFEIILDPAQEFYEVDFNGRLIEIPPKGAEHFRLEVQGGTACANRIFRFRLGATAHDNEGTKEETASDRAYHLAFSQDFFNARAEEGEHGFHR